MSMKVIKKDVEITLHNHTYKCDIILGLYVYGKRPAIILVDASSLSNSLGEVVCYASTNAPPEYLTGMPQTYFAAKDYGENEGLWDQLETLTWEDTNTPLFLCTSKRLTLGLVRVKVYDLGPDAADVFQTLLSEIKP